MGLFNLGKKSKSIKEFGSAAIAGDCVVMKKLIENDGIDVNLQINALTVYQLAQSQKNYPAIELLSQHKDFRN